MTFSIRTKLALAIGVPLLAAYLVLTAVEHRLGKQRAVADMQAYVAQIAAREAAELDGDLRTAAQLARDTAGFLALQSELSAAEINAALIAALSDNPRVFGMCAAFEPEQVGGSQGGFATYYCRRADGKLRHVDVSVTRPDFAGLDWYSLAKAADAPIWSEPYFDAGISDRLMATFSAPLRGEGRFRGVVTVDLLSADMLADIARLRIGGGYSFLLSSRGAFISHPDSNLVMRETIFSLAQRQDSEALAAAGLEMLAGRMDAKRFFDSQSGEYQWIVFAPVPSTGWSLATVVPESEVLAPVYARLGRLLFVPLVGLCVIAGIVLLVSQRVTRPIARLSAAAEMLGGGDLDARVSGIKGRDELACLAETFNTMVVELKSNIDARLREEDARRAMQAEIRAAREIQTSLLPTDFPSAADNNFSLHAVNDPAKQVAGDFYDFFRIDDRRLAVAVADVSGKGLPAAVYMAVVRTKLRDFASAERTPAEVVAAANRSLAAESESGMFATLFFGYYDIPTGEMEYVNAGHPPPLVLRRDERLEALQPTGPLVGPLDDAEFAQARCRLEPDETLVVYTDGVTEAHAGDFLLFGQERLDCLLRMSRGQSAADLCEQIAAAARDFSAGEPRDDATVLALRREPRPV